MDNPQAHRRIDRLLLTYHHVEMPVVSWADEVHIPAESIFERIVRMFWDIPRALETKQMWRVSPEAIVRLEAPRLRHEFICWRVSGSFTGIVNG